MRKQQTFHDTRPTEAHLIQAIRAARTVGANGLTTEEAQLLGAFASGSLFVRDDIDTAFSNGVTFCADCETLCRPSGCGTGYASLTGKDDGKRVCYSCADARQREDLKDRSGPFTAYLSSDGKSVTTWTGGRLMGVTYSKPCELTRQSYTHDLKSYRTVWARDVHGGEWRGRGSPGICIKLFPTKSKN